MVWKLTVLMVKGWSDEMKSFQTRGHLEQLVKEFVNRYREVYQELTCL